MSQRSTLRLSSAVLLSSQAGLWGLVAALGRPGADLGFLFCLGFTACFAQALRAPGFVSSLGIGLACGLSLGLPVGLGALSWGHFVPVSLAFTLCGVCTLPLMLWAFWAQRWLTRSGELFLGTMGFCTLLLEFGDHVGFPQKAFAAALVGPAPWLVSGARLVGVNVLEALLVAVSLLAARAWCDAKSSTGTSFWRALTQALQPALAALALVLGLGLVAQWSAPPGKGEVAVGIPQINVGREFYEARMTDARVLPAFEKRLATLLAQLTRPELLVMTETFDGAYPAQLTPLRTRWSTFAKERGQAILLSSYLAEADGLKSNAVAGLDRNGSWVGLYRKLYLAPHGEVTLQAGSTYAVLTLLPGVSVGPLVCFESQLTLGRRAVELGATLLAAITSDVSFHSSFIVFEHLAATQLRAVELGRSIVWASNAGPSGWIDRFGSFTPGAPFRQPAAASALVPLQQDLTPFVRVPALTWPLLAVVILAGLCWRRRSLATLAPAPASVLGLWSSVARCLLWLGALPLATAATPALVEFQRGDAARMRLALADLLQDKRPLPSATAYDRFFPTTPNSTVAVVAYWLEYYGFRDEVSSLRANLGEPSDLDALARRLLEVHGVGTRRYELRRGAPRIPGLVQRQDGAFGVVFQADPLDPILFFNPQRGGVEPLRQEDLNELRGGFALLLADPPEGPRPE